MPDRDDQDGTFFWSERKGVWIGRTPRYIVNGKEKRRECSGSNKPEVYKRWKQLMREYEAGERIDPTRLTLTQYIEREWWPHARHGLQPSTATRRWAFVQNQILAQPIARVLLAQLSPRHVKRWLTAIRETGIGDGTVQGAYDVLHAIVKAAKVDQYLTADIMAEIDRPQYEAAEPEILDLHELAAVLEAAAGSWWQPCMMLSSLAFLRIGEALALKRPDLDRRRSELRARRNVAMVQGHPELHDRMKTKRSRRAAPLDPRVFPILDAHEAGYLADIRQVAGDRWQEHDLLFPNLHGGPQDITGVYKGLRRLYQRAGVRYRPFHIFRHTGASYAIRNGMNIRDVMAIGGWTNMQTLLRYVHALADQADGADRLLAAPIESMFAGAVGGGAGGLPRLHDDVNTE